MPSESMATTHDLYIDEIASISIEEPLCNYLTAFDGTAKEFDDIQCYFDDLFAENMIHLMDGDPVGKETFVCMNKHFLRERFVATLEDIEFVDDTHVEYTVHWGNEHTSWVTHVKAVVVDGKIIKVQPCEETKGAYAGMHHYNCQTCHKPVHQPLIRFRDRLLKVSEFVGRGKGLFDGDRSYTDDSDEDSARSSTSDSHFPEDAPPLMRRESINPEQCT
mmetsp:Transcript_21741/g.37335  ORF Transcript_21741/g.37335 Transcript_21741/m.37335 type:complete len:219 (+) Transcript_21741:160-816(+)|eukprot:CAMPEP_0183704304 /NCGR_PEP_ID=MMETSP0737-20130205/1673_1 /TAXON_ID=385413 /ORGANISM="Thalassiosira miniscula, Strain CCMP1093" /LENGTH=218 /DNA_ID=CAMNT_0025931141 /DNA_START=55 /DNA_END=711 /DNA_ORIENTATION=-